MQVVAVEIEEGKRDGWRRFARDVGVNVLANLSAAAIVYLLAVAGGYLTANRRIIAGILTVPIILAGVAAILYVVAVAPKWGRWWQWASVPLVVLLMGVTVMTLGYLHFWVK